MAILKNILSWFLQLFGNTAVDKTVEAIEKKTGWDIPEDTIVEFANKILPKVLGDPNAQLWDRQGEILKAMESGSVMVDGDRGTGKTIILLIYAVYTMITKPDTKVKLRSVNHENGKNILHRVMSVIENTKEEFGVTVDKYLRTSIKLGNGSSIELVYKQDLSDLEVDFDIFLADEISFWETKAIEGLIKRFPKHKAKIQLVSTDWDDKVNDIIDVLPETIEVLDLAFFDKDKDIGDRMRSIAKVASRESLLREFGTIFRK